MIPERRLYGVRPGVFAECDARYPEVRVGVGFGNQRQFAGAPGRNRYPLVCDLVTIGQSSIRRIRVRRSQTPGPLTEIFLSAIQEVSMDHIPTFAEHPNPDRI